MKTLLIYRSGIASTEFNETYNKYKKTEVYSIIENTIVKNLMSFLYKDVVFYTTKELFEGELNNMKFDNIIGNPPYQDDKKSDAGSLYVDITRKCLTMLKPNGSINFVTRSS